MEIGILPKSRSDAAHELIPRHCSGGDNAALQRRGRPRMTYRIAFPMLALLVAGGCSGRDSIAPMCQAKNLSVIAAGRDANDDAVVYASAATATAVSSDIMLVSPDPGNNVALGHVELDRVTRTGTATFSGGTGKFQHFSASVTISFLYPKSWAWDGTYRFRDEWDRDDRD